MDKRSSKEEFEENKQELESIEEALERGEYKKLSSEKEKVKLKVNFDSSYFGDLSYDDFMTDNFSIEIEEKKKEKPKVKEITTPIEKNGFRKKDNKLW